MIYFTSDEHFGHANILNFCNRPFKDVFEMDTEIIKRFNEVVTADDTVIHGGDVAYRNKLSVNNYIDRLNGKHIFLKGSHDKWNKNGSYIWEGMIEKQYIVVCHYAMITWPRSHYGSWQLFGHSHGNLKDYNKEKQYDIGVDNNDFYPVSFEKLKGILK